MLSLDASLMLKVAPEHYNEAIVGVLLAAAITINWTSSKTFGKYESTQAQQNSIDKKPQNHAKWKIRTIRLYILYYYY